MDRCTLSRLPWLTRAKAHKIHQMPAAKRLTKDWEVSSQSIVVRTDAPEISEAAESILDTVARLADSPVEAHPLQPNQGSMKISNQFRLQGFTTFLS